MSFIQPINVLGASCVPDYSSDPFISGYELNITGNTTFTLSPGAARCFNSPFVITYNPFLTPGLPALLSCDISTTGPGGCYPYPIANVDIVNWTNMGIYVIGNTTGTVDVYTSVVVATGDNFLPPSYNVWRRVGSVYVDNGTRYLLPFTQTGNDNNRTYVLQGVIQSTAYSPTTNSPLYLSSASGGIAPANPNFVSSALLYSGFTPSATSDYAYIAPTNGPVSFNQAPITIQTDVPFVAFKNNYESSVGFDDDGNALVYVSVVGSSPILDLGIYGWKESLGLQAI